MVRGHTKGQKCLSMLQSAVACVPFPAVARKRFGKSGHNPVAGDFCDDRSRCNRHRAVITLDQALCRARQIRWQAIAIDQSVIGNDRQGPRGAAHRQISCLQDIERVNLRHLDDPDAEAGGIADCLKQLSPSQRSQLFGIPQARRNSCGVKHNCGGDNRSGKGVSSRVGGLVT